MRIRVAGAATVLALVMAGQGQAATAPDECGGAVTGEAGGPLRDWEDGVEGKKVEVGGSACH